MKLRAVFQKPILAFLGRAAEFAVLVYSVSSRRVKESWCKFEAEHTYFWR